MCNPLTSWTHSPIISCQSWSISVLSSTQYYPQCNPVCTCSPHKSTSYFLLFKVQINTLSTLLILKSFSFAPSFPLSAPNHCTPILSCFYLLLCLFSLVLVGNHINCNTIHSSVALLTLTFINPFCLIYSLYLSCSPSFFLNHILLLFCLLSSYCIVCIPFIYILHSSSFVFLFFYHSLIIVLIRNHHQFHHHFNLYNCLFEV